MSFTVYHCSPTRITKVLKDNSWGGADFSGSMFFALEPYSLGPCRFLYSMELQDFEVIESCRLDPDVKIDGETASEKIIHYASVYDINIDEEDAEDLLCDYRTRVLDDIDSEARGYIGWFIQGIQGRVAREMGYIATVAQDEQGTVYIAHLHDREHLLSLEPNPFAETM